MLPDPRLGAPLDSPQMVKVRRDIEQLGNDPRPGDILQNREKKEIAATHADVRKAKRATMSSSSKAAKWGHGFSFATTFAFTGPTIMDGTLGGAIIGSIAFPYRPTCYRRRPPCDQHGCG